MEDLAAQHITTSEQFHDESSSAEPRNANTGRSIPSSVPWRRDSSRMFIAIGSCDLSRIGSKAMSS